MKPISEKDFPTQGSKDPTGVFDDLRQLWEERQSKDKHCLMVFVLPWDMHLGKAQEIVFATQLINQEEYSYKWLRQQRKKHKRLSLALSLPSVDDIDSYKYDSLICSANVVAKYRDNESVDVTKNMLGYCGRYYLNNSYFPQKEVPSKKESKPPYDLDDFLVRAKTVLERYEHATSKYRRDQTVSNTMLVPSGLLWWTHHALNGCFDGWENIILEVPRSSKGVDVPFRVPAKLVIDIITQYNEHDKSQGWCGYEKLHTPKSFAEAAQKENKSRDFRLTTSKYLRPMVYVDSSFASSEEPEENKSRAFSLATSKHLRPRVYFMESSFASSDAYVTEPAYIAPGDYLGKVSTPKSEKSTGVDHGPSDKPTDNKYHGVALGNNPDNSLAVVDKIRQELEDRIQENTAWCAEHQLSTASETAEACKKDFAYHGLNSEDFVKDLVEGWENNDDPDSHRVQVRESEQPVPYYPMPSWFNAIEHLVKEERTDCAQLWCVEKDLHKFRMDLFVDDKKVHSENTLFTVLFNVHTRTIEVDTPLTIAGTKDAVLAAQPNKLVITCAGEQDYPITFCGEFLHMESSVLAVNPHTNIAFKARNGTYPLVSTTQGI